MNDELLTQLQAAASEITPQLKALQSASGALKTALKLAADEKPDALPMQKAAAKLDSAAANLDSPTFQQANQLFHTATQQALDDLAFSFAHDLKETFEAQGLTVEGRPPTLLVNGLTLHIDVNARKAQWFYGKEALTRPQPLSIPGLLKAFQQQQKLIMGRSLDAAAFLVELHKAWQDLIDERLAKGGRYPNGGRLNLIEVYSKLVMNRQSARFWNAPSRQTFKDYERPFFIRDLVLVQENSTVTVGDKTMRLRLGVATKSQADNPTRSAWLPENGLDGQFYGDVAFETV